MAVVVLFDIDEIEVSNWARTNCGSFVGWLIYENSDAFRFVNLDDDTEWIIRYEFDFADEHEAMIFQLRWQGQ